MGAWTFGAAQLPVPSSYTLERARRTAETRALDGTLRVDTIVAGAILSHELSWAWLTAAQWAAVKTAFDLGPTGTFEDGDAAAFAVYWPALDKAQPAGVLYGPLRITLIGTAAV